MSIDSSSVGDFLSRPPSYAAVAFAILGIWWGYKEIVKRTKVDEKTDDLLDRLQARCDELEDENRELHAKHVELAASGAGAGASVMHMQSKILHQGKEIDRLEKSLERAERGLVGAKSTLEFISFQFLKLMVIFEGMRWSASPEDARWDRLEELLPAIMKEVQRRNQLAVEGLYGDDSKIGQSEPGQDPSCSAGP